MQRVDLNKEAYSKREYTNTIDTEFSQLVSPSLDDIGAEEPTVEEFFEDYETLFFQIPKTGENSHETLITRSTEYIGFQPLQDEIQALTEEITSLRQQLLEARQQLVGNISQIEIPELPELSLPEVNLNSETTSTTNPLGSLPGAGRPPGSPAGGTLEDGLEFQ